MKKNSTMISVLIVGLLVLSAVVNFAPLVRAQPPTISFSNIAVCTTASSCSMSVSIPANSMILVFPSAGDKSTSGCATIKPLPSITSVTSSLTWTKRGTSSLTICESVPQGGSQVYPPGTAFQIFGGEEWYAVSSNAISDSIVVNAASSTDEVAFTLLIVTGSNTANPFELTAPCISSGLSLVLSCNVNTSGSDLIIGSEEALNGICAGLDFTLLSNTAASIQNLGIESETGVWPQSNLAVTFNQACVDTNIMGGNDIWIMTADVLNPGAAITTTTTTTPPSSTSVSSTTTSTASSSTQSSGVVSVSWGYAPTTVTPGAFAQWQAQVSTNSVTSGSGVPISWYLDGILVYSSTTGSGCCGPHSGSSYYGTSLSSGSHTLFFIAGGITSSTLNICAGSCSVTTTTTTTTSSSVTTSTATSSTSTTSSPVLVGPMSVTSNADGGFLSIIQANGLYWIFFQNGPMQFVTCPTSNCVWSSPTNVPTTGKSDAHFWNTGNTVYFITSSNTQSDPNFYFGSGTLNSAGTITWNPEQAVPTGYAYVRVDKGIADSNGHIWVAVSDKDVSNFAHFQVFSYTGSWAPSLDQKAQNAGGFPNDFFVGYPVELTLGKVAVVYQESHGNTPYPNVNIQTCSGIGCTWSARVTSNLVAVAQASGTSIGDVVQFCGYNSQGTGDVDYGTYQYGAQSISIRVISPGVSSSNNGYDCAITTDGTQIGMAFTNEGSGTYFISSSDGGLSWSSLTQIDSFGITHSQRQTVPPTFTGSFPLVWYNKLYPSSTIRFATLA